MISSILNVKVLFKNHEKSVNNCQSKRHAKWIRQYFAATSKCRWIRLWMFSTVGINICIALKSCQGDRINCQWWKKKSLLYYIWFNVGYIRYDVYRMKKKRNAFTIINVRVNHLCRFIFSWRTIAMCFVKTMNWLT